MEAPTKEQVLAAIVEDPETWAEVIIKQHHQIIDLTTLLVQYREILRDKDTGIDPILN